tara:strand:- start:3935 stop:4246 length:312 start_codon:yes stop_codon:yes gene_type:complete
VVAAKPELEVEVLMESQKMESPAPHQFVAAVLPQVLQMGLQLGLLNEVQLQDLRQVPPELPEVEEVQWVGIHHPEVEEVDSSPVPPILRVADHHFPHPLAEEP